MQQFFLAFQLIYSLPYFVNILSHRIYNQDHIHLLLVEKTTQLQTKLQNMFIRIYLKNLENILGTIEVVMKRITVLQG